MPCRFASTKHGGLRRCDFHHRTPHILKIVSSRSNYLFELSSVASIARLRHQIRTTARVSDAVRLAIERVLPIARLYDGATKPCSGSRIHVHAGFPPIPKQRRRAAAQPYTYDSGYGSLSLENFPSSHFEEEAFQVEDHGLEIDPSYEAEPIFGNPFRPSTVSHTAPPILSRQSTAHSLGLERNPHQRSPGPQNNVSVLQINKRKH